MKKAFCTLLAAALLLTLCSCGKSAETQTPAVQTEAPAAQTAEAPSAPPQAQPAAEGKSCGEKVLWALSGDTLVISGEGAMYDYDLLSTPWDQNGAAFGVKKLRVEEGVTYIGTNAFGACCNLTEASLPSTLLSVGSFAFSDCVALKSLSLPRGLLSLGEAAFSGSGLTELTLPEGMAAVGRGALANCGSLTAVSLPGSLLTLGESVFDGDEALALVAVPEGSGAETLVRYAVGEELLRLSAAVPAPMWEGHTGDMTWSLRDGVLTVGGTAAIPDFDASGISAAPWAVLIPAAERLELAEGVESVGANAFWNCSALKSVSFPSTLKTIGTSAFSGCAGLETLNLPVGLETIGAGAFSYCLSLSELTLPEGLRSLGSNAFQLCTGIRSLTAPASLTDIGDGALAFGTGEVEVSAPAGSAVEKLFS